MVRIRKIGFLSMGIFLLLVLLCFNFTSAWVDCGSFSPWNGKTASECNATGSCIVTSINGSVAGYGNVRADPFCYSTFCCLPKECWQWDGTNQTLCEANGESLNCTWNNFPMTMYLPNGTQHTKNGTCMTIIGGGNWGGTQDGCWQKDGNKQGCYSKSNDCEWKPNEMNQNPWCGVKNLQDAVWKNPLATSNDIGCCDKKGCWSYNGNQTLCVNSSFKGLCSWNSKANDPWCPNSVGCCVQKSCSEVGTNETLCNLLKQQLMMPCNWNGSVCKEFGSGGGGGFSFFNDTDSCMKNGGWFDMAGICQMPNMTTGGGAFMFGGEAHCYFADNQQQVCGNITGCAYCVAGSGVNGVDNTSVNNACYRKQIGLCEGHDKWAPQTFTNANNADNLNCTHIKIKSACIFGPLPNCKWDNSTSITGAYCNPGKSTETKSVPPVPFCEHPDAKNNYTMCTKLAIEYMMPCKWYNTSTNLNGFMTSNCTFNPNAVFGTGDNVEQDFGVVNSEYSCIAAGGTWQTEYYFENNIMKHDSWCEKGALFDSATGMASGNKGNCDTDCWACEFRYNGSKWDNASQAESVCAGSDVGTCRWTNNTNAPNQQGWCDYPQEMNFGAGDCNINCKDCEFQANAYSACLSSFASCKWENNTNSSGSFLSTGTCMSKAKKSCSDDCFSCYSSSECSSSSLNCGWDEQNHLCKPSGFEGEICFDGIENDNDGMTDCGDPDCSFDNACGGNNFANCGAVTNATLCNSTSAFGGYNCTWYNFTWEPNGHCGMPGENCWQYDGNSTLCGSVYGCTNGSNMNFGKSGMCDLKKSLMDGAQCWNYMNNASGCTANVNCSWINWTRPDGGVEGNCEPKIPSQCHNHRNSTSCGVDGNCSWIEEPMMMGNQMVTGHCEPACFVWHLNESTCATGNRSAICEWKNMSSMCMPATFDIMGGVSGGKMGCPQYDGNMTACQLKNATCVWMNDSYVNNNVSANILGQNISGWCNDKAKYEMTGDMKGEPIMLGMDSGNVMGGAESGVVGWADIKGFGMRVTDKSYGFGVGMHNLTNGAICNGYQMKFQEIGVNGALGSGQNITKMKWYLDTDGNLTSGTHCNYNSTLTNFEFYIDYVVRNNTLNGNIETTTKLYSCVQNSTGWQWVSTNVFVADDRKFTCWDSGMGAVFVSVEKESLENFPLFDMTKSMRVFASSFNGSNESNPADTIGPAYYTPGTIDFGFVDCSNPNVKDPKCKNFQKFGTQVFEDCKNGKDDDSDGYSDCADPKCVFTPICSSGTAFNWSSGCSTDFKTPIVTFTNIDKMADSAIVQYDSDEPANGSLMFYNTTSACNGNYTQLNDTGDPSFEFDNYKPFHRAILDSDTIGYPLINNTAYYYKLKICDSCGNCGSSACLNFTTKKENKPFMFKMDLPAGYSVNITSDNAPNGTVYSGNFTQFLNSTNISYDVGVKVNSTMAKNMNITVIYGDLSMKFIGADLYKPKVLNMENAFIADTTNEVFGMNSTTKSWNFLLSDLGMGGSGDSIELNFPVAYSASNTIKWVNDEGANISDVTSYTNCSGDSSHTSCKIPVSLGFSKYYIQTVSNTPVGGSSGGGGGGGGAVANATNVSSNITKVVSGDSTANTESGAVSGDSTSSSSKGVVKNRFSKKLSALFIFGAIFIIICFIIYKKIHHSDAV